MKVIVLGAGITGTAAAWFLNKAGHEVVANYITKELETRNYL